MFWLKIRMWLLIVVLFAIIYAVIAIVAASMGISNFYFYLIVSLVMMLIQYMLGPKLVEWTMRVRYVTKEEYPRLFKMVEELSMRAKIPTPRVGIARISIPNAFAFGRTIKDGRVCITEGILRLLNEEELRAVLGHELSHLKNRDVLTITLLSVIPMILYRIAWSTMYTRRRDNRGSSALVGLMAFIFYFITNLLVLYASRIREYFADRGSVLLGNHPSWLASSLYKLVYGSARMDKDALKEVEGLKAFFVNDPSCALNEIRDLRSLDLDKNGTIDAAELAALSNKQVKLSFADKLLEVLSTHPNMLKRIQRLSQYQN
ncbi:MAG: zinc metalloprotease HtpX [Candidatus Omnitrophica bacterium]|nr:zinc metalloprotease HtpX [Candidatus Omnitrophota bacterium]